MSVSLGPNIATNGLIFSYDMNNILSWRGAPVTNQFAVPTPYNSAGDVNFAVQGTTGFRRIYEGTYGQYTITNNDVVYRYDLGSNGCHYHGNSVSIPAGVYPIFRFDYYISPDATGFPTSDYLANFENYGGGAQGVGQACPNYNKGIWQTVTFSGGLTGSTGTQAMFLYPGGCGGRLADSGYILYKNPQVLFSSTANFVAPFVGPTGVRSNTQSIFDLTGTSVVTASSLNYSINNTFSFDNTKVITVPMSNLRPSSQITQECWFSTTSNTAQVFIGAQYGTQSNNSYALWLNAANQWAGGVNIGGSFNYQTYSGTVNTNTYYHFVHTYDGANQRLYINGTEVHSWATSGGIAYDSNNTLLAVGNDWNGSGYDTGASVGVIGTMPLVRIYNTALTAAQVAQNFAAQRSLYGV